MENASKALLIAAAVLIAIIIITVGIKIFTSTSDTQKIAADTGKTISDKTGIATDSAISAISGNNNSKVINYGEKTKETVVPGDDISIGDEKFRVVSNTNGKIVAMPHYNLVLTTEGKVKQATADTVSSTIHTIFTSQYNQYWAQIEGWNNNSVDYAVDIDMTVKNGDLYKNNVQQYIDAYRQTLENMRVKGIIVRACRKQELDSGLNQLSNNSIKKGIRNPSGIGDYWLSSADSNPNNYNFVWVVLPNGELTTVVNYYNAYGGAGIRPVIEIP